VYTTGGRSREPEKGAVGMKKINKRDRAKTYVTGKGEARRECFASQTKQKNKIFRAGASGNTEPGGREDFHLLNNREMGSIMHARTEKARETVGVLRLKSRGKTKREGLTVLNQKRKKQKGREINNIGMKKA